MSSWYRGLTWFLKPHPRVLDEERQQQSRLLAGVQFTTVIVGGFIIGYALYLDPSDLNRPETRAGIALVIAALGLYAVTRLGYVLLSAVSYILIMLVAFALPPYLPRGGEFFLAFTIIPVLLTAVFFRLRWVFGVTVLLTASALVLNQVLQARIDFWSYQFLWYFQLFASALIITISGHLNTVEAIRLRKLRESEATLERRVKERTNELQDAYEQVQALNQAHAEFVSNVSHELRTPITNLKLHQALLAQDLDDGPPERIQILNREVERLDALIESLLLISRLDQRQVEFQFEAVDLNRLVNEYVTDRQRLAQEHQLSLTSHLKGDSLLARADPAMLGQVISILLTNAMHYTPAGGHIDLKTDLTGAPPDRWTRFIISDNGHGISRDEKDQLFSRFFRGTAARRAKISGTGLGLAIASEIVERHQGRIEVDSSGIEGEGTTFTVWLPPADSV